MSEGLQVHADRLEEAAAEPVLIIRGATQVPTTAVPTQTVFDEIGSEGEVRAQVKSLDFLIQPKNYRIGGVPVEPQKGDQIKRASGDVFDLAQGISTSTWEWSDAHKSHYRIHTVRRVKG